MYFSGRFIEQHLHDRNRNGGATQVTQQLFEALPRIAKASTHGLGLGL